jgi:hypothetical protein
MDQERWIRVLGRYAERLHAQSGSDHHVVSPLGAWLVVALCAPLAQDETLDELREILGVEPDAAAEFAASLLSDPHPLVSAGAGAWVRLGIATNRIAHRQDALPSVVATGGIPVPTKPTRGHSNTPSD